MNTNVNWTSDHYVIAGIAIGMFLIVLYVIILTVLEKDEDEDP